MDSDEENMSSFSTDTSNEMDSLDSVVHNDRDSSFEALTAKDIVKMMNQYIEDVISVNDLPATTIRILLGHTKWDKQELLNRLFDGNRNELFEKAHVTIPSTKPLLVRKSYRKTITCVICFCDFPQTKIVSLGCKHEYCEECWRQYLTIKISDDGDSDAICCPAEKCDIIVDDVTIMQLVSDENVREKYRHLMTNSFVVHNRSLRWCPSPGCELAIRVTRLLTYQQNCTCECGYSFCFNCGDECHDPLPCTLMAMWKKNNNDLTIEYLTKYTKGCPNCKSLIEKNGGCNHMTCRKCKHEFCWLCFGNWKHHNSHDCTSYQATGETNNDRSRWEHYFKLYASNRNSLKAEKGLVDNGDLKGKMDQLQEIGVSWTEAQFLMKAIDILCESRKQLMLTCIFAYYVKAHNQKSLFEINQSDLQSAAEALSRYLEQDITTDNVEEIMLKVKNKATYCELRQNALKEHIYQGFEDDWWSF